MYPKRSHELTLNLKTTQMHQHKFDFAGILSSVTRLFMGSSGGLGGLSGGLSGGFGGLHPFKSQPTTSTTESTDDFSAENGDDNGSSSWDAGKDGDSDDDAAAPDTVFNVLPPTDDDSDTSFSFDGSESTENRNGNSANGNNGNSANGNNGNSANGDYANTNQSNKPGYSYPTPDIDVRTNDENVAKTYLPPKPTRKYIPPNSTERPNSSYLPPLVSSSAINSYLPPTRPSINSYLPPRA